MSTWPAVRMTAHRTTTFFVATCVPVAASVWGLPFVLRRYSRETQDQLAATNTIVEETLQAIASVKAFANEAFELGRYEILANAIAPGFMRTRMSFIDGVDETTTPDFQEWYVKRRKVPMGRTGIPEDMAGTAVFLASRAGAYLTGAIIPVDGGIATVG